MFDDGAILGEGRTFLSKPVTWLCKPFIDVLVMIFV